MFDKLSNGMSLARSSWGVLAQDKKLIWFPLVSGLMFVLVVASFAVPLATLVDWAQVKQHAEHHNGKPPAWVYAVGFAFYFATYSVMIFCNAALVSCAMMRFNGREPSLSAGFGMAMSRLPQILAWALVSATVGVLLQIIESAYEDAGYYISLVLGTAWSVMTFFVVPVLVVEKTGPVASVGRSVSLVRQTWGEALVGRMGINFFLFLLAIPVFLLFVGGALVMAKGAVPLGAALIAVGVVAGLLHMAVSSALNTILLAALYQYAADRNVPTGFSADQFESAFQSKNR
ncbi:Uncharacterized protein OS=Planctomyces brasiliensis (strain ATCC 49424 / DSM 5305 / JCM 21570 / NBRC 103401 / IFAM 1448) GN=Plabr_3003 PE=4 SV=1 [Gemmataceae bacterium]|nr:Uncharacterized protein OS=Planctomyces brasiliensis (strain ATCC 49424 / DSM 5305 / JCM 21570 / NBRC 103401 / IFAM 1448) GN=Plabr_3003 PE=4 SV=1 [Gemmataceae bacterium]VTT99886.1 Uncharacterized protein OS=Planctomyces brasiliensis (strain ATCC 49424 / DSM 5305 / JCM 21570 / NBRC 103401 / IFAM 1448) GN=Plabr_3003 PE=4 SV=1 [Gemmataceae bacterium]